MATTAARDYYGVLGIAPTATEDEIRHAYRKLAKLWHPDRYSAGPEHLRAQAERRMRLLTEAHSVLADPEKRAEYDSKRHEAGAERPRAAYAAHAHHADGEHTAHGHTPPVGGMPFYGQGSSAYMPGYMPSRYARVNDSGENNPALFIGLMCVVIALVAFANIRKAEIDLLTFILLGIFFLAGGWAIYCFANADKVSGMLARATTHEVLGTRAKAHTQAMPEDLTPFESLVQQILWELPEEFADKMENVIVVVEPDPTAEVLRRVGVKPGAILLGLYQGVPTTQQHGASPSLPETITLYQNPIERYCLFSPPRIEHQIEATLLHELAHHFGIDHEEMPIWVKA